MLPRRSCHASNDERRAMDRDGCGFAEGGWCGVLLGLRSARQSCGVETNHGTPRRASVGDADDVLFARLHESGPGAACARAWEAATRDRGDGAAGREVLPRIERPALAA